MYDWTCVFRADRRTSGENVDPVPHLSDNARRVLKSQRRDPLSEIRMAGTDKRKQSLYFPEEMLREIQEEATRQDRSLSWVVQQAWKIARERIKAFPAVNDVTGDELPDRREE